MLGQNLSKNDKAQLSEFLQTKRFGLKLIFQALPAPVMTEVAGEYDARLLDQGDRLGSYLTRKIFGSKGPWIGKAFRPLSDASGEGYNAFGSVEDRSKILPMDTYIGPSLIVDGHSYVLDYREKNRGPIRWLTGELRQVSPDLLLGMGTFGPRLRKLHKLRRVIPFVLVRSDRPYLADGSTAVTHQIIQRCSSSPCGSIDGRRRSCDGGTRVPKRIPIGHAAS
jgi:hypothetical protein